MKTPNSQIKVAALFTLTAILAASSAQALSVGMGPDFTSFGPITIEDGVSKTMSVPLSRKDMFKEVIVAAKEDASAFVATGGELRGADLERAFQVVREFNPHSQASDLEIAQAILAY